MQADTKYCIIGAGGSGREVLCCLMDQMNWGVSDIPARVCFLVDDSFYREPVIHGVPVYRMSEFDTSGWQLVVAIGDSLDRAEVVGRLPRESKFATVIHPSAIISPWVTIGEGSVVAAGVIITCDIVIGRHAHLNRLTSISHDCHIGDFFTAGPGVLVSGNCRIGHRVYMGTNSSVREKLGICDDVVIGMGATVVKPVMVSGTYVGNPARRINS